MMSWIIKYSSRVPEGMTFSSLSSVWWEMDYTHSIGWNLGSGREACHQCVSGWLSYQHPAGSVATCTDMHVTPQHMTQLCSDVDRTNTMSSSLSRPDFQSCHKQIGWTEGKLTLWGTFKRPSGSFLLTVKWSSTTKSYSIWPKLTSPSWLFPSVSWKSFRFTIKSPISMEVLSLMSFVTMLMASSEPHMICRGEMYVGTK